MSRRRPDEPHPRCQAPHLSKIDRGAGLRPGPIASLFLPDDEPPAITPWRSLNSYRELPPPADVTPLDKLLIRPGDTLVVRVARPLTEHETDRYHAKVREQLPASVGVVIVNGDEVALIRPDTRHLPAEPVELTPSDEQPADELAEPDEPVVHMLNSDGAACGADEWPILTLATTEDKVTCEACKGALAYMVGDMSVAAERLARAHEEIRTALNGTPERERIPWEQMPASYRTRLAAVFEDMLANGVIRP